MPAYTIQGEKGRHPSSRREATRLRLGVPEMILCPSPSREAKLRRLESRQGHGDPGASILGCSLTKAHRAGGSHDHEGPRCPGKQGCWCSRSPSSGCVHLGEVWCVATGCIHEPLPSTISNPVWMEYLLNSSATQHFNSHSWREQGQRQWHLIQDFPPHCSQAVSALVGDPTASKQWGCHLGTQQRAPWAPHTSVPYPEMTCQAHLRFHSGPASLC